MTTIDSAKLVQIAKDVAVDNDKAWTCWAFVSYLVGHLSALSDEEADALADALKMPHLKSTYKKGTKHDWSPHPRLGGHYSGPCINRAHVDLLAAGQGPLHKVGGRHDGAQKQG